MNFEDSVLGMETGLGMSSLTPMIRQRAKPVIGDGNLVYDEDWSDPEILRFEGYLYSRSSVDSAASEPRDQGTVSDMQLMVPIVAIVFSGHVRILIIGANWGVTGMRAADQNRFPGWRPTLVADLEQVTGGG